MPIGVIVLAPDGPTAALGSVLACEIAAAGCPTWLLAGPRAAADIDASPGLLVTALPALPEPLASLASVVPLQLVAAELAGRAGRRAGTTTLATKVTERSDHGRTVAEVNVMAELFNTVYGRADPGAEDLCAPALSRRDDARPVATIRRRVRRRAGRSAARRVARAGRTRSDRGRPAAVRLGDRPWRRPSPRPRQVRGLDPAHPASRCRLSCRSTRRGRIGRPFASTASCAMWPGRSPRRSTSTSTSFAARRSI